ncbi:hypothetical protein H257_05542 [Aphanomyces astaci]|uniref:Uncharacterized protein n=1 Tax=Aphanomyces astaci TaxID=112090 RepID=W4GRQ3_APHAT|nr:hypothetical protein H257_05542 [Aphanomyces astaci]ETV82016.1 hypothetical protein H257_05542 [Aphanomyces astaci]KAF0750822.1 hypothetical protein AaE_006582 [Aphanomyces astaci]RHY80230.1 hypothetical protein DYB30_012782 [Aphanomyces astaci]RHZ23812.1 hypothetical protein DYB31_013600 [Aphanomyces astaci]RQM11877.1 hypothetical protein B5M09_009124 [Aphanomyces astaci]|eukprot:XP_009828753.1 hypothetical protein H257_05542 [Aphanomyces astaci]
MITANSDNVCKYSYKKCMNPRTTKRNGTLHSLCEFHRVKANTLQQIYAKKKKDAALMLEGPTADGNMDDLQTLPWPMDFDFSKPHIMTEEDCRILQELL